MGYSVKLKNATTGWLIEDVRAETLGAAIRLQNSWFKDFHTPLLPEYGIRPLVSLPVTVSISRTPELEHA